MVFCEKKEYDIVILQMMREKPTRIQRRKIGMKVTFMGAGSTVFSKNVLGDTMLCEAFHDM